VKPARPEPEPVGEALIPPADIRRVAGISRAAAYMLEAQNRFPRRRRIPGTRRSGWLRSEVEAWLRALPAAGSELRPDAACAGQRRRAA
jgi:predicted DNA-binding transcriptional regulator AlpA